MQRVIIREGKIVNNFYFFCFLVRFDSNVFFYLIGVQSKKDLRSQLKEKSNHSKASSQRSSQHGSRRGRKRRIGGSTAGGIGRIGEAEAGVASGRGGGTEVEKIKIYGFYDYVTGI